MAEESGGYSIERRGARHKVDFRIRLVYLKDGATETSHGHGSDLSEGGMAVYAATEMTEGMHVKLELTFPYSRRVLWIEAVVRNKQGYRYGLEFLTLSSTQREEIARFCQTASVMNSVK
jgi:c-di-GMP-binding flagellar brake protein YcgR